MAVTDSPIYEFPMASAGTDPAPDRVAWMAIFQALEDKSLAIDAGALSGRPTTPAKPLAWLDTARNRLSIHMGGGSNSWADVPDIGGPPADLAWQTAGTEGSSATTARADHTHKLPNIDATQVNNLPASTITTGQIPVERGGTGRTTLGTGAYLLGNGTSGIDTKTAAQVLADIAAVPTSRKIAGKTLTGDITLDAADIADTTTTGQAVMKAASEAAARAAIGAGTSSLQTGSGASDAMPGDTTAANLGALQVANGMTVIEHGSNTNYARPAGIKIGWWVGTAEPNNKQLGDWWDDGKPAGT